MTSLLDKREADNSEQELIESPFRKWLYATRERVYKGAVLGLTVEIVFLVLGVVFLLT